MISESGHIATNEMYIKLDLQFPSECCCGTIGAVGLINDLGVNASVTLFHSGTSSESWLFFFTLFIWISHYLDIFREAHLGLLKSSAPVACGVMLRMRRNCLWEEPKLLSDASGCQWLWQWIIVLKNVILHSIWNIPSLWKVRVDLLVRLYVIYCSNAWNGQPSSVFYTTTMGLFSKKG